MKGKGGIIAGILTVVIGGTAYSISQGDVVRNFSQDTGLSQQEAQEYVDSITEEDLASWSEIGAGYLESGQELLDIAADIDCVNYEYEWETGTLSCSLAKSQIETLGDSEIALGESYEQLDAESATTEDIETTIGLIDSYNDDLEMEVVQILLEEADIDESKKTNSYNKAVLQSVLDSQ